MERSLDRVRDRVDGILLGLAVGDRNGGPIRMAVRLAESLVARGDVDIDDIAVRYFDWCLRHWTHRGPRVYAGGLRADFRHSLEADPS